MAYQARLRRVKRGKKDEILFLSEPTENAENAKTLGRKMLAKYDKLHPNQTDVYFDVLNTPNSPSPSVDRFNLMPKTERRIRKVSRF